MEVMTSTKPEPAQAQDREAAIRTFLIADVRGYTHFTPPAMGERVHVPAVDLSRALLGNMMRLPFDGRLPPPADPQWDRVPALVKQ